MTEENEYLLGTGAVELDRLMRQHQTWSAWTERLLDAAAFAPQGQLLDLGAGPGFTTLALAQRAPQAQVLAVDTSARFAAHLMRIAAEAGLDRVQFRQADVHLLAEPDASFDGVFARWVFCFLKSPETVVQHLARLLRPGGRLAILDYFNYLAVGFQPHMPELAQVFPAVHTSFAHSGGNLDVCGALPGILARNGFRIEQLIPICEVSRPGEPFWLWFKTFRASYFDHLVEHGYLTAADLAAFDARLAQAEQEPGTFFFTPPMMGIVAVRS